MVPTLLQHFSRAGLGWADCSSMSGPCPGLGGRRMGGSKTTRFSVDGSTQLFLAHTKTGELLLYRTCVTLVLEHAELQELVPGIRVRDVNDDQSGSVSSTFVSWSPYFHLFGGENRGGRIRCLSLVIENQRGEHRTVPWDLGPHAACSRRVATLLVERMFRFTTYSILDQTAQHCGGQHMLRIFIDDFLWFAESFGYILTIPSSSS